MNPIVSNQCLNCTTPVATGPGRTGKFCSRSCATTYNNTHRPKRQLTKSCKTCTVKIKSTVSYCSDCSPSGVFQAKTLGELRETSKTDASVYNRIRLYSRNIAMKLPHQHCIICGYHNHVEVAHLRTLSTLSDDTTVEQAGGAHNFVLLCPNHHWEFDYGNLTDS